MDKKNHNKSLKKINFSLKKVVNHFKYAKYTPANKLSFMHYVAFRTKYIPFIDAVKTIKYNDKNFGFLNNYIDVSKNKNLVLPDRAFELINILPQDKYV